jgi:glucosyl-dolichyl phosphate glucuronosyltransferase
MRVERIVITADVFRTTSGDADQLWNVGWLHDELAPILCEVTGLWPEIGYRRNGPDDGRAVIAQWYELLGQTPSRTAWVATFGITAPPQTLVEAMSPDYEGALVIGFELSPLMRSVLDAIGVPWIDVGVSPVRFLDDLALNLRFSWPVEAAHPGLVSRRHVRDAVARLRERYGGDTSAVNLEGSCVFLAQTRHDRTLIKDGCFFPDSETIRRVGLALDGRPLFLKPHPLAPDNPLLPALEEHFGARTSVANTYAILALAHDVQFLTISSSAAIEARHFEHTAEMFHPAAHTDLGPFSSLWAHRSAVFWRSILTPLMRLKPVARFEERATPDRLRRLIGSWGMATASRADVVVPVEPAAVITVAICTYNRHHLLQEAVHAILRQTADRNLFKVLIVDNSTDAKAASAFYRTASFDAAVSVVRSEPPGLSRARNRAAAECATRYIAYLDDDARPDPTWLSGLLAGFAHAPNVAAVGGPVSPIWRNGRPPAWLPRKHLGLLTINESTEDDRNLGDHQYLYGANMAFAVECLQAAGGFPEQVGRNGTGSLLSCEETQVQDALRAAGHAVRFVRAASVRHIVHEERLRRSWLRSRMIWQSVSEQLQEPPLVHKDWALNEIRRLAELDPDAAAAARLFFKDAEGEALDRQLDAIRHFSALLMAAHQMPESAVKARFAASPLGKDLANGQAPAMNGYAPSAAGASDARYLFIEALPGHRYLYDLYGDIDGAQLLTYMSEDQAWGKNTACQERFRSFLGYVRRSIGRKTRALFFVTYDGPAYGSSREDFFRFLQDCPVPVSGILHRMPETPSWLEAARQLDGLVDNICLLSETMADYGRTKLGLSKACHLPHHSTTLSLPSALCARDRIRARLCIRPEQVAFAVIGEARRGKGIPWLLSTLSKIPAALRDRMFFIFAGKATEHSGGEVQRGLDAARLPGVADLRAHPVAAHYAVLSDREYAEYVAASDIGLLLYQDGQRQCMSGVLGDYLWANCKVVATTDSFIGAEVRRHNLGLTLRREDASTLAAALTEAVGLAALPLSAGAEKYRASIAPQAVLQTLRGLLSGRDAGEGADLERGWERGEAAE